MKIKGRSRGAIRESEEGNTNLRNRLRKSDRKGFIMDLTPHPEAIKKKRIDSICNIETLRDQELRSSMMANCMERELNMATW